DRHIRALVALQEARLARKADLDILDRMPRRDRDAVPLVEAVQHHLVAGILERLVGELLGLALDLLERDDVDVFAQHPVDRPGVTRADRVDVPGRDAHALNASAHRCRSNAAAVCRAGPRSLPRDGRRYSVWHPVAP